MKSLPWLLLPVLLSCQPKTLPSIVGHYTSKDDLGVLVFRLDGVFGYKAPAKFDFYGTENLPPNQARYKVTTDSSVEISNLPQGESQFTITIKNNGNVLILTRSNPDPGFPKRSTYVRQ